MIENEIKYENPMGTKPVLKLLLSLGIPAVIANLVNALYNIVDQIFIGNKIGYLGNAATNIAFPLTTICMAIGLMLGIGSAAGFNLNLGRGNKENAKSMAGTAFSASLIIGVIICILVRLNLKSLMIDFGATENILDYTMKYAGITSFGIPFLLFSTSTNPLVRGDGNAKYSMMAIVTGAFVNIILDALFMYGFNWGIEGAAWATVIGQGISALILIIYFKKFRNVKFQIEDFIPKLSIFGKICTLGFASFIFQSSMVIVQVTSNNLLRIYGDNSIYGSDITIAVAGIVAKISLIFIAIVIGFVQGGQPIFSYNYGARKYLRVHSTMRNLLTITTVFSAIIFAIMEISPREVISIFGKGSEQYFEFGVMYARGFFAVLFVNGVQIASTTFFPSIGKAWKGSIISVSKQLLILVPLMIILAYYFGLKGIIVATPISDFLAFLLSSSFLIYEMKKMPRINEL